MGIEAKGDRRLLESQAVSLKGLTHGLIHTPSELQHRVSSLRGTRDIQGGNELSSIRERAVGWASFSQTEVLAEDIVPLIALPHRACRQVPYLRLHQRGSHCLPHPDNSLKPHPPQLSGTPKLFPVAFSYEWPILAHVSDFPKISQQAAPGLCEPRTFH